MTLEFLQTAGVPSWQKKWIPAFAGMTTSEICGKKFFVQKILTPLKYHHVPTIFIFDF
jgi:hypothetical protein